MSNICERNSARKLALDAFLKSERSGTFSKFMIIAILVKCLPYKDLSGAVSVGTLCCLGVYEYMRNEFACSLHNMSMLDFNFLITFFSPLSYILVEEALPMYCSMMDVKL